MNFRDDCFFLSSESRPSVFVGPFVVACQNFTDFGADVQKCYKG